MTRLTSRDIDRITDGLAGYNKRLIASTGRGLLEIACHCYGADVDFVKRQARSFSALVIPVTSGLGVITDFSDTVAGILSFLGTSAEVSPRSDVSGLALAVNEGVDAIFMADDTKFIGLNCNNRKLVDNSTATGTVYAAALNLMSDPGKITEKMFLIAGCGPVGQAAAEYFIKLGAMVTLVDRDKQKASLLRENLKSKLPEMSGLPGRIRLETCWDDTLVKHRYILDATPDASLIKDSYLSGEKKIAIPGVPPGISDTGFILLGNRVVHDKLELGVAAMAVSLLI